jgi:glucose-6-phosphate 1-epimerase
VTTSAEIEAGQNVSQAQGPTLPKFSGTTRALSFVKRQEHRREQGESMHADRLESFGIPNALRFEDTPGGLVRAVVSTPQAEADIHLQGAHVAHWTPRGRRPVLFVSPKSLFARGKAIRGGVPVIWPWFGGRGGGLPGPAHGLARTTEWSLVSTRKRDDGAVEINLALTPNDVTRNLGFDSFRVHFRAAIGSSLELELVTHNESAKPLVYEEALHSYFSVADIHEVSVTGLEGTTYIDKTDGFKQKREGTDPMRIAKETDQVHLNTKATRVIHDPVWKRRIVISKTGSDSTVVWNPWIEKTKGLSDMAPEDWREMICVETANAADNAVMLPAGGSRTLRTVITVE